MAIGVDMEDSNVNRSKITEVREETQYMTNCQGSCHVLREDYLQISRIILNIKQYPGREILRET